jgi:hypothetical protein
LRDILAVELQAARSSDMTISLTNGNFKVFVKQLVRVVLVTE